MDPWKDADQPLKLLGGQWSTRHIWADIYMDNFFSLAHKLNVAGHVIVTTGLRRMHFPRPGFFLR